MSDTTIPTSRTQSSTGFMEPLPLGYTDEGEPVVLFVGSATSDAEIIAAIGSDAHWGDGSIYISAVGGAGTFWQKRNDVWTSI